MKDSVETPALNVAPYDLMELSSKSVGEERPTREEFYTNYPFFKYWRKDSNEKLMPEEVNIYIHIPFCIQLCDYCFYMKDLVKSKSQVDEYIDYLCREMQMVSEIHNLKRRKVNSIYIGGGTPSVLTEAQLGKMIEALRTHHWIENPEFTFEAEPGTFSRSKLQWYKESGVNRISMGVQSFDDRIIKLSSRKHTAAQAIHSIAMVKEAGGFSVNIDLLSGLTGEEMRSWEQSVDTALAQDIDMLTIYKMKAYANTVFFKKGVHAKEIALPAEEQEIAFMDRALDMIAGAGFRQWSTFAFTSNGYTHKYVENTWRGKDLIAYGASSFGLLGNINYQNSNDTATYYRKINAGTMPVFRTYPLTHKDLIVKELLLCPARLASYRKSEFIAKFGFDYFELIPGTLAQLAEKGYITGNTDELTLTKQGVLFSDYVGKALASAVKEVIGKDGIGFIY